ncbi:centrosomin-like [Agrilus planipennis]|nr:centrosomin-like [Agrilus planipennis]
MSETAEGTSQLCEQYKTLSVELEKQVQILLETLNQKDAQLNSYKAECESQLSELQEKQNRIIDLEFELLSTTQEKSDASNEKECSFWKRELMEKDKEISRLEIELRKRTGDLQTIVNKELWEKNREIEKLQKRYGNVLELKDKEIVELRKDIEDKESQLTLLKDKISELGAQITPESDLLPVKNNEKLFSENKSLEESLYCSLKERKELIKQSENLKHNLNNSLENNKSEELAALKDELEKCEKLRHESQDICSVLSTRLEELCQFLDSLLKQKSVLGFLGNKQKSHLRKIIDQSLDLSRTLSISISLNPNQSLLQLSNLSNLLDLTHETNESINSPEETSLSILPDEVSLTYQSHLKCTNTDNMINSSIVSQQAEIINILREQVENLKKEIELRDTELENKARSERKELKNDQEFVEAVIDLQSSLSESSKHVPSPQKILQGLFPSKSPLLCSNDKSVLNTTSTTLKNVNTENQSESECWSEPDRKVSMQRMGIIDDKVKTGLNSSLSGRRSRFSYMECLSTESTEDERNMSLSRTPSKRSTIVVLHEQICELEDKLRDKEKQLLAVQIAYFETEKVLNEEKAKVLNYIKQEEQLVSKMKSTEDKLREAEQNYEAANKKLEDNNSVIATLEQFKSQMEEQLKMKDKEMHNIINELEKEKDMAIKAAEEAEKIADNAKIDIKNAELKLCDLKDELAQIENKTRQSLEEEYKNKLRNIENDFQSRMKCSEQEHQSKLQSLEHECESQIKSIRMTIASIKEACAEDQKRNSDVANETTEVEYIMDELESIRKSIRSMRAKVKDMEENEEFYKEKIFKLEVQNEEKIKNLYIQLDTVALQHSETMLEKTKLMNEKNVLEQDIQKYIRKEEELIRQVNDFQREFTDIRHSFQKQLSYLENLKVSLEAKVTQLESSNADLRRRIMSSGNINVLDDNTLSYSLPNSPTKYADLYPNKTLPIRSKKSVQYFRELSDTAPSDLGDTKGFFNVVQLQAPNVMEMEHDSRHGNSSPDLGIESDQGRFSSLEANVNIPRPLLPTLELTESMNNLLDNSVSVQDGFCNNENCIMKIKEMMNENSELKKRLLRTRRALEETVTQLTLANKRKKEVEKTICKQIHKTSQVLRKAKANLDSGSETEVLTKK